MFGKAVPADIVCLNSSLLQQRPGEFQGHGFIGVEQMRDAAQAMGWGGPAGEPRALRIVVLHHHVLPTTFSERIAANYQYSVVLDAEALIRWIVEHRVNLVLHGHMHQPYFTKISRPEVPEKFGKSWHEFYVLGMGSSGVEQSHLGEVAKNTIGVLTFNRGSVKMSVLSVHPVNQSEVEWAVELPIVS